MSLRATCLFHLNLQYSSLEVADRARVVDRCYRPMLDLLDQVPGLVLAVEASAATLEAAGDVAPDWLARLAREIAGGRVELIGSGDTQLIGPLVPASVHRQNQRLGVDAYEELCGVRPTTALVGEMAWSRGIIDGYLDAGYDALVMEWNNARALHPEWENEWRYGASWTRALDGRRARVVWADAVAFQKFQRAVHGDLEIDEAAASYLAQRGAGRHLFVYANDAEVLDHRPGRYAAEPRLHPDGEWRRAARLLCALGEGDVAFTTPREIVADVAFEPRGEVELGSSRDPIPVKKQPKYNATRWALSGRDDVGLNARCFAEAHRLEQRGVTEPEAWRRLCRLWSSDLRTHLTDKRWRDLQPALPARGETRPVESCGFFVRAAELIGEPEVRRDGRMLHVDTGGMRAVLNLRRGLALEALEFHEVRSTPLIGTIAHGDLDDIRFAADFYSGHTVLDVPGRQRVTDLEAVEPEIHLGANAVTVLASVPTALGHLRKRVVIGRDRARVEVDLSQLGPRPLCSLRTGHVTLLGCAFGADLTVTAAQGGAPERWALDGPCDHTRGIPPLVTASAAFGATDGTLTIDDGRIALELTWDPGLAAALPMLVALPVGPHGDGRLVRLAFSLSEVDDTFRADAERPPLPDFAVEIAARRLSE